MTVNGKLKIASMKGRCYSSICLDLRKPVEIRTSISQLAVRSVKGKGKSKVHPRTGHEGPEGEYRYSSTLSLTLALNQGGWSTPRPGRFTPGIETRYPLYRRLGGPQGRSGRLRKISPPPGFDPRIVQPMADRYTD